MPDVECRQLQQVPDSPRVVQPSSEPAVVTRAPFTREELAKKNVAQLKALAKELKVLVPASVKKKDDLIAKILAKPLDGHSEQRAIQDI
jgi:hypothetical protein